MRDTYNNIVLVIKLKFHDLKVFHVNSIRVFIFPCDFLSKHDSLRSHLTLVKIKISITKAFWKMNSSFLK
jgi:hypothetical protein